MQVRRILDNIRGRPYEEALGILEYLPYRAAEPLLKLLISVGCLHVLSVLLSVSAYSTASCTLAGSLSGLLA